MKRPILAGTPDTARFGHEPVMLHQQRELAEQCSAEALRFFGYDELAELLTPTLAGSGG